VQGRVLRVKGAPGHEYDTVNGERGARRVLVGDDDPVHAIVRRVESIAFVENLGRLWLGVVRIDEIVDAIVADRDWHSSHVNAGPRRTTVGGFTTHACLVKGPESQRDGMRCLESTHRQSRWVRWLQRAARVLRTKRPRGRGTGRGRGRERRGPGTVGGGTGERVRD
jgi:hypothetical protein